MVFMVRGVYWKGDVRSLRLMALMVACFNFWRVIQLVMVASVPYKVRPRPSCRIPPQIGIATHCVVLGKELHLIRINDLACTPISMISHARPLNLPGRPCVQYTEVQAMGFVHESLVDLHGAPGGGCPVESAPLKTYLGNKSRGLDTLAHGWADYMLHGQDSNAQLCKDLL